MTGVICDMCGTKIKNANREQNYWTIGELDLCPACVSEFEAKVQKSADHDPYSLSSYKRAMNDTISRIAK